VGRDELDLKVTAEPGAPGTRPARRGISLSRDDQVLAALLVAVPATLAAARLGAPEPVQFFLSVVAVVPLAGFIGSSTEALADRVGARTGGLLNATFGNTPDLLIGIFGVQRNLIPLVKATLIGALISNSALIMGLCCLLAGLRHGRPRFRRLEAGHHSVLMLLTLAAILFPSAGSIVACGGNRCSDPGLQASIQRASDGIAVALLLGYVAYVVFGIFGLERLTRGRGESPEARVIAERAVGKAGGWPLWFSVAVLAGSALLLIPVTDILTGTVTSVTHVLGWSTVFVGIVVVANAGNVAEAYAAIRLAIQRPAAPEPGSDSGLDLALGIASASSIQIAAFVAPLIVIYSLFVRPMTLVFSTVEVAMLGLLVLLFSFVAHDGESNWLEGFQLLVLYAMAAVIFYTLPPAVFGG
jgi:Ca2+:H+ antiporter